MRATSIVLAIAVAALSSEARGEPALSDYRTFRHLAIDLLGRPPTRAELAAFARPGFAALAPAWLTWHHPG